LGEVMIFKFNAIWYYYVYILHFLGFVNAVYLRTDSDIYLTWATTQKLASDKFKNPWFNKSSRFGCHIYPCSKLGWVPLTDKFHLGKMNTSDSTQIKDAEPFNVKRLKDILTK
jgi:hypothetical protein